MNPRMEKKHPQGQPIFYTVATYVLDLGIHITSFNMDSK
jgi:hypothetical protein